MTRTSSSSAAHRRPWLKRLSLTLIEGPIVRNAAAVQLTSQAEWDEVKQLKITLRGVIIPLAVRLEEWETAGDVPLSTAYPIVLYLSRLDPKKNIEGLLKAFAIVQAERSNARRLATGSPERKLRFVWPRHDPARRADEYPK